MAQGDEATAETLFRDGLADERNAADPTNRISGLLIRAMATMEHGDPRQAHERLLQALEEHALVGQWEGYALCLEGLASLALRIGKRAIAARLCGAASAVWSAGGMPRPWYQKLYESRMRVLRAALAEQEPGNWRDGMALPVEQVMAIAASLSGALPDNAASGRAEAHPAGLSGHVRDGWHLIATGNGTSAIPADATHATLTRRELEVLGRLAEGASNREIAAALVLSVRTVERHLDNIYAKTGLHGRQQLRAYARSHELVLPA